MTVYSGICRNKSLFDEFEVYLMERLMSVSKADVVGEHYGK